MIEKEARLKVINLSRLEEIKDLRTVWPHEALDFTPWLSQDDNISLLADAVGMDITVDETESSVGDFNVDIFASETGTDRKIIIENQLEDTNHDHLGKLIVFCKCKFLKFADKNGEFCISVLEKVAGCPAGLPDAS